ncbi:MAG: hypothetical protein AAF730_09060 [Bacteroidota bacterium]
MRNAHTLTQAQLDLLALFERTDLPDEDWIAIRRMIAHFFAERLVGGVAQVTEEKGWTDADFHRMAREHYRRTPNQP